MFMNFLDFLVGVVYTSIAYYNKLWAIHLIICDLELNIFSNPIRFIWTKINFYDLISLANSYILTNKFTQQQISTFPQLILITLKRLNFTKT